MPPYAGNIFAAGGVYWDMAMSMGGQNGARAEINITPMIDVLLVLLIIFMVIVPTKSVGFDSAVPQPANEAMAMQTPPATLVIFAKGGGMVEVNRQPVEIGELAHKLLAVFHGRPDSTVFVGGEPQLEFGEIARLIDAAKDAGIRRVALLPKDSR